jgi:hypothetical protein
MSGNGRRRRLEVPQGRHDLSHGGLPQSGLGCRMEERMNYLSPIMTIAAATAIGPAIAQDANVGSTFPQLSPGQTEYVVTADQAVGLVIGTLYLPRGLTIRPAPGVTRIDWTVRTLKIDEDTTFDLSAPQQKPAKAAAGAGAGGQASYCVRGGPGAAGATGARGHDGASLTLRDIVRVENNGSLWIRSDGGPGGDGGDGGAGQLGGGPMKKWTHANKCGGAPGGAGGADGAAGQGGRPGTVTLKYRVDTGGAIQNGVSSTCGRSQRPSVAHGTSGVLVIWSSPGCPGKNGVAGPGGRHG